MYELYYGTILCSSTSAFEPLAREPSELWRALITLGIPLGLK